MYVGRKQLLAFQAKNPHKSLSKRETLKAFNVCLICLIFLKFSTFTQFYALSSYDIFVCLRWKFKRSSDRWYKPILLGDFNSLRFYPIRTCCVYTFLFHVFVSSRENARQRKFELAAHLKTNLRYLAVTLNSLNLVWSELLQVATSKLAVDLRFGTTSHTH